MGLIVVIKTILLSAELELSVPGYRLKDVDILSLNNQKFSRRHLLLHCLTPPRYNLFVKLTFILSTPAPNPLSLSA